MESEQRSMTNSIDFRLSRDQITATFACHKAAFVLRIEYEPSAFQNHSSTRYRINAFVLWKRRREAVWCQGRRKICRRPHLQCSDLEPRFLTDPWSHPWSFAELRGLMPFGAKAPLFVRSPSFVTHRSTQ